MKERKAISFDFDGVLFPRIPIQLEAFKPWNYNRPLVPTNPITRIDRMVPSRPLSREEYREVERHFKRHVKPEIAEVVKRSQADIKIGNTGRPNNLGMVSLTHERLQQAGIKFEYIDFKPEGVSSDESKYWSLLELVQAGFLDVTHFDDNANTVKRLAPLLPQVRFVIVQDLTSGLLLSRSEMQRFPNVVRVAQLKA